jgi:uncharacterized protein
MVIDIHTHIMASTFMSKSFQEKYLVSGYKEGALDYVEIGPKPEMWDMMLQGWGAIDIETMGNIYLKNRMDAGIDLSVVFHVDIIEASQGAPMTYQEVNKWFAEFAQKHSDRVIAFAGIDPNRGEEGVKFFEKCVRDWGMRGLKFHPVAGKFYPNDKKCYPYYAKASELKVPVLFHTGPSRPGTLRCGDPMLIDEVAEDFPDLTCIIAHLQDPWIAEPITIVQWRPNVYLDISVGQVLYRTEPDRFYRTMKLLLRSAARRKVLFGTDCPGPLGWILPEKDWVDVVKNLHKSAHSPEFPVDQATIDALLAGNAKKILGIA